MSKFIYFSFLMCFSIMGYGASSAESDIAAPPYLSKQQVYTLLNTNTLDIEGRKYDLSESSLATHTVPADYRTYRGWSREEALNLVNTIAETPEFAKLDRVSRRASGELCIGYLINLQDASKELEFIIDRALII